MGMKLVLALGAVILTLSVFQGCVGVADLNLPKPNAGVLARIPDEHRADIRKSLEMAGLNAPEIEKFLFRVSDKNIKYAAFLIANMSPGLLATAVEDDLSSEFELAIKAKTAFPWSSEVSEEMFLHYVLPFTITQEPFENYRKYMFPLLKKALANCETLEQAALELNRWCGKRFTYKSTQRRDQGVFENLKRGYGRCEEMMILYICAARTACIPARNVLAPLWSVSNSNHAWVEVWTGESWKYLGACEPADKLNKGWFTAAAARAPLVLANARGKMPNTPDEKIYRRMERQTLLNVTSNYSRTGTLKIETTGDPLPKEAFISVFNFGGMRPFARVPLDEKGRGSITLGIGDFLATCSAGDKFCAVRFSITPDKDTLVELEPGSQELEEGRFWLRYPKTGEDR